ncbi:MAG: SDR family NAD(P)-dependent oxidoreductase [Acidimicrobiales bacterium]
MTTAPRPARLAGKVALITGGANGLGRATAVRFAEEGAAGIVIGDVQEAAGRETLGLIEAAGGQGVFQQLDATSRSDNEAMVATALERFGQIDVLVTAAGVGRANYVSGDREGARKQIRVTVDNALTPWVPFLDVSQEEFQAVLDVNLTGTLLAVQAVAAHLVDADRPGSLITIASILARSDAGPVPYNVSKAGVWMLTKVAARALAPKGIRVNSIGPGYIETNMTVGLQDLPDDFRAGFMMQIPMGRLGQPVEVANTALFLASDESSYFTGELLHPDGGFFTG